MAGRKVRFSAAKVVSKRRTTGTSPGAKVCYGDTGHAQPSLQNGAVQLRTRPAISYRIYRPSPYPLPRYSRSAGRWRGKRNR